MSSAILLRRFLDKDSEYGVGGTPFAKSTVSVVAAVLKTLQTSDFQKVLSDTLRFAPCKFLKRGDFQRANLSKAYLGCYKVNGDEQVNMEGADFFQANLTGTSLRESVLNNAVFYEATLNGTRFQGAELKRANFNSAQLYKVSFRGADLRGATFDNAILRDIDFTDAKLEGVNFTTAEGYDIKGCSDRIKDIQCSCGSDGKIFISRLGSLDTRQLMFVNSVKDIVTKKFNLSCIELDRGLYDASNVMSSLSDKIESCSAMIVFGFKSIHVINGVYRDSTEDSSHVSNLFLSTPWNHIEVGMAIMNRIPVLLLVEEEINDGVFSANINDKLVVKIKIKDCLDEKKNNVGTWLKSIVRPFAVAHGEVQNETHAF